MTDETSDPRPYVVPRISDKGTILLLDHEQREIHLSPRDAAEMAIQILRSYARTHGFSVLIPIPPEVMGTAHGTQAYITGYMDADTLNIGGEGAAYTTNLVGTLKASHGIGTLKASHGIGGVGPRNHREYYLIRRMVLKAVRKAIGVDGRDDID